MKKPAYPWVRWRVATHCALVEVPAGWTLSVRVAEPEGISSHHKPGDLLRWGQRGCNDIATLPVGLLDVRLRPGVHKR